MHMQALSDQQIAEIRKRFAAGESKSHIARVMGLNRSSVQRYTGSVFASDLAAAPAPAPATPNLPAGRPANRAGEPPFPPSLSRERPIVHLDTPGVWLILGDVHLPYHDVQAIQATVTYAK